MTPGEALALIQKKSPTLYARSCLDFGTFYAFSMAPLNIGENDSYAAGRFLTAVDKKNKNIFDYDITSDLDLFENAKIIF